MGLIAWVAKHLGCAPAAASPQGDSWPGPRRGATVLFLDIDGVLHPAESGSLRNVGNLVGILHDHPELDVVISSNWRINASRQYLVGLFPLAIQHRIVGVTPIVEHGRFERELECIGYCRANNVTSAIALDDDSTLFSGDCPFLFHLDRYRGLDQNAAVRLRHRILTDAVS